MSTDLTTLFPKKEYEEMVKPIQMLQPINVAEVIGKETAETLENLQELTGQIVLAVTRSDPSIWNVLPIDFTRVTDIGLNICPILLLTIVGLQNTKRDTTLIFQGLREPLEFSLDLVMKVYEVVIALREESDGYRLFGHVRFDLESQRIWHHLTSHNQWMTVDQVATVVALTPSQVRTRLEGLRESGLVFADREGRTNFYHAAVA